MSSLWALFFPHLFKNEVGWYGEVVWLLQLSQVCDQGQTEWQNVKTLLL